MPDGRKLDTGNVDVIHNWGTCHTLFKVQTLLGTVGLMHIYIWNYVHHIHALNKLTCKDIPFKWGPEQITTQDDARKQYFIALHLNQLIILQIPLLFSLLTPQKSQSDSSSVRKRMETLRSAFITGLAQSC